MDDIPWYIIIYIYYSGLLEPIVDAIQFQWVPVNCMSSLKQDTPTGKWWHEYQLLQTRLFSRMFQVSNVYTLLFSTVPTLPPLATKLGISKWYLGHIHTNHESNLVFLHSEILYSTSHPVPTSLSGNGAHHHRNQPFVVTSPTIRCAMRVVGWVGIHQHHSRVGLCILEIEYLDLGSYINR